MKSLVVLGWIFFALDALFVAFLFISKNAGDDAAGRGVATGYAMVLVPLLLLVGGVLWWGAKHNSSFAILTGVALVGLPFVFLGYNAVRRNLDGVAYAREQARNGQFKTPLLSDIAKTIEAGDTTKIACAAERKSHVGLHRARRGRSHAFRIHGAARHGVLSRRQRPLKACRCCSHQACHFL